MRRVESDSLSLESVVADAADDFVRRLDRGERPDVEDYARRWPQFADEVRQALASLELVRRSSVGARGAGCEPGGPGLQGQLGDFQIVREVACGGMGVVYEARQKSLGRRVALKVLPSAAALDPRQLQRFRNEAEAAAHLNHANIVPVYAVGCERGVHYFAMQFIDGRTLADLIGDLQVSRTGRKPLEPPRGRSTSGRGDGGPAPETVRAESTVSTETLFPPGKRFFRSVARIGIEAALALEHAHQMGVIHRDVKPANFIVDAHGRLWITDFGLALLPTDHRLTSTGDLVGTLRYMSPEQVEAKRAPIDHRTDIYSLGATLYELLTLTAAFDGADRQELLRKISSDDPARPRRLNRNVPAELETIVLKAMSKGREERYATAQELADDLARFVADEPIRARRPGVVQRGQKWARRHKTLVGAASVVLLVAVAAVVALLWQEQQWSESQRRKLMVVYRAEARERERAEHNLDLALDALQDAYVIDGRLHSLRDADPVLVDREFFQKGLHYFERLTNLNGRSPQSRFAAARAWHYVSATREELKQYAEAEAAIGEALARLEELTAELPGNEDAQSARLDAIGLKSRIVKRQGREAEAEQIIRQGVALGRELSARLPTSARYEAGLGLCLHNLAKFHESRGELDEMERLLLEAIEHQRAAAAIHPEYDVAQWFLAQHHLALGQFLEQHRHRSDEAEEALRIAERHAQQAAAKRETDFKCLGTLGDVYFLQIVLLSRDDREADLERVLRAAVPLWRKVAHGRANILDARRKLAVVCEQLGIVLLGRRDLDESDQCFLEARRVAEGLEAQLPDDPEVHVLLGGIAHYQAIVRERRGDHAQSRQYGREAIGRQLTALAAAPGHESARRHLAQHFVELVKLGLALERRGDAEELAATIEVLEPCLPHVDADRVYDLACLNALCARLCQTDAPRAEGLSRRAMELLNEAAVRGFADVEQARRDSDLDWLRSQADFQAWLANLATRGGERNAHQALPPVLVHVAQGDRHAWRQEWAEAIEEFEQARALEPGNSSLWLSVCLAQLGSGDAEGHRRTRQEMLERFGETKNVDVAGRVVRAWLPDGGEGRPADQRLAALAHRAALDAQGRIDLLGPALLRAGRFAEALEALQAAQRETLERFGCPGWLYLGLTHHRLGQVTEAKECLANALQWTEEAGRAQNAGLGSRFKSWKDRLEADSLRREAQSLLFSRGEGP
jgi:hypothetical protein